MAADSYNFISYHSLFFTVGYLWENFFEMFSVLSDDRLTNIVAFSFPAFDKIWILRSITASIMTSMFYAHHGHLIVKVQCAETSKS